mgnify:CR=1 FL=1
MIIYKATNKVTGKCYIGKTIQDFEIYKNKHLRLALSNDDIERGHERPFYKAIRKYGTENFDWCVLEECKTKELLNERERYYISLYQSYENGYNATKGGDGGDGGKYERTDDIKQKISLSLLGHKRTEESKRKQGVSISGDKHPLYGKGHRKDSIEKMSKSKQGLNNPNGKRYKFTSPDGEDFIVEGRFNQFCKEHHLWHNAMTDVHRGKKESHKGWKCFVMKDSDGERDE